MSGSAQPDPWACTVTQLLSASVFSPMQSAAVRRADPLTTEHWRAPDRLETRSSMFSCSRETSKAGCDSIEWKAEGLKKAELSCLHFVTLVDGYLKDDQQIPHCLLGKHACAHKLLRCLCGASSEIVSSCTRCNLFWFPVDITRFGLGLWGSTATSITLLLFHF